jgi:hypothetical protein
LRLIFFSLLCGGRNLSFSSKLTNKSKRSKCSNSESSNPFLSVPMVCSLL